MKGKKIERKLALNKKTVADLSLNKMDAVKGGRPPTECTYCLYTCTGQPCWGWATYEFRTCAATCETFACTDCGSAAP
jgi:hypothetical protein